jgi:hypothetical protein
VRAKPSARLQLTTTHSYRDARTGSVETFKAQGLEIGGTRGGNPTFYLNGQSTADAQKKLGIGTGTALLIAGGAVLVLLVVAMSSFSLFPECKAVGGNDDHCTD